MSSNSSGQAASAQTQFAKRLPAQRFLTSATAHRFGVWSAKEQGLTKKTDEEGYSDPHATIVTMPTSYSTPIYQGGRRRSRRSKSRSRARKARKTRRHR